MTLKYYQYEIGEIDFIKKPNTLSSCLKIKLKSDFITNTEFLVQLKDLLFLKKMPAFLERHIKRGMYIQDYDNIILFDNLLSSIKNDVIKHSDDILEYELKNNDLKANNINIGNETYYYFYETKHPFSQWHSCKFEIEEIEFNSAEQYMMYKKAILFKDNCTASKILKSKNVREQKQFGREVENFDKEIWNSHAIDFVYKGNKAKFSQNKDFKELLLSTKETTLVEASPTDTIWGIGYSAKEEQSKNIYNWRGLNWLGIVLTELRYDYLNSPASLNNSM